MTTNAEVAVPQPVSFERMMALESHGADTFVGVGPDYPWGGLYGGQIVAQALRAAGMTVDDAFRAHSLHGYFIRRGDSTEPIRFEVDRIRNGRSFCTRRVVVRQSVGAIFNLSASFHVVEQAADVQKVDLDVEAVDPDRFAGDGWSHVFDRRTVPSESRPGESLAWFRMLETIPDDPMIRACALAYLSDDLPTEACFGDLPDFAGWDEDADRTYMSASLDHSIWFHRDIDPGHWHLHHLRSRGLVGSRGLSSGEIHDASGVHAATVTQEVLIRKVR